VIYLATPIKHKDPAVESFRIETANHAACTLHDAGIRVFSPASHGSSFSSLSSIRQSWQYWESIDIPILTTCCTHLVVLCMDGWDRSIGVKAEIAAAGEIGLLLTYVSLCQCGKPLREHQHQDGPARPDLSVVVRRWETGSL
jgi:hypothetical protein